MMNLNTSKRGALGGGSVGSNLYLIAQASKVQQAAAKKMAQPVAKPKLAAMTKSDSARSRNAAALARTLGDIPARNAVVTQTIPRTTAQNRASLAAALAS